ncbi:MAG: hypothetical protein ACRDK7_13045, partial [Solirubrobacteraceae bacterium]
MVLLVSTRLSQSTSLIVLGRVPTRVDYEAGRRGHGGQVNKMPARPSISPSTQEPSSVSSVTPSAQYRLTIRVELDET